MSLNISAHAAVSYDDAVVALANYRVTYPLSPTKPWRCEALTAIEMVFTAHGEHGLAEWLNDEAKNHEAWAIEQVNRLWPGLKPPSKAAA